jgi:hypothetical protein
MLSTRLSGGCLELVPSTAALLFAYRDRSRDLVAHIIVDQVENGSGRRWLVAGFRRRLFMRRKSGKLFISACARAQVSFNVCCEEVLNDI